MDDKCIISIGGNIGSGKSTLMNTLQDTARIAKQMQKTWKIIPEPVDKWGNWLNLFYSDMSKYSFGFQMKILYEYMFVKTIKTKRHHREKPMDSIYVFAHLLLLKNVLSSDEMELLRNFNSGLE